MAAVLAETLHTLDERFLAQARTANDSSGTTAVLAILAERQLLVANIGDSQVKAPPPAHSQKHLREGLADSRRRYMHLSPSKRRQRAPHAWLI